MEYHHFPLSFHKYAETAAIASMAAHRQGKFWEMVDKLYADTQNQDDATLLRYAEELGLNMDQFKSDIVSPELIAYVRMDMESGKQIGVGGTPSMYINGSKATGNDFEALKTEIDAELAAVQAQVDAGKTVDEARRGRTVARGGASFVKYVVDRTPMEVDTAAPGETPPAPPAPAAEPPDTKVYPAEVFPGDPMKGPADALVTIVECTDFQ